MSRWIQWHPAMLACVGAACSVSTRVSEQWPLRPYADSRRVSRCRKPPLQLGRTHPKTLETRQGYGSGYDGLASGSHLATRGLRMKGASDDKMG